MAHAVAHRRNRARQKRLWHHVARDERSRRNALRLAILPREILDLSHNLPFFNGRGERKQSDSRRESLALEGAQWQGDIARRRRFERKCPAFHVRFSHNLAASRHDLRLIMVKRALQKSLAIGKRLAGRRFEHNGQQTPGFSRCGIDLRRRRDQTGARLARIAGFEAIGRIPAKQKFVFID